MAKTRTFQVMGTMRRGGAWVDGPEIGIVIAVDAKSARRKIERELGYGVGSIVETVEDDDPDCDCGWRGQGSGPDGRFMRGDRCPACGQGLD
jgi:hypothetical protein